MAGTIMGTPQYMAPEQARGEVETMDQRADIYALGAILFHLLHLRPSVEGEDAWTIVTKVARGEVEWTRRKSEIRNPKSEIPSSLAAVVRKAMAFDRAQRYASVPELQRDLEAYQGGFATSAEKAGLGKHVLLAIKRHKAIAAGIVAVLLVGTAFGTKAILEGRRAERGEAQARAALAALKKQAPALLTLGETEADFQRFDSALEKLDAALALDPSLTDGWWRRAWVLLAQEKFAESAEAVRTAQQRDPARAARFGAILPLLGEFATASAETRWTAERGNAALAHLKIVGASGEAIALSVKFRLSAADKMKLVQQRVGEWLPKNRLHVGLDSDGSISLTLPKAINTLDPLRGLPINQLTITNSAVADLEPLRGMPLHTLSAAETPITDLSPLRDARLRELNVENTRVADLSPLKGQPIERLTVKGTLVQDLSPLRGMPLVSLTLSMTKVRDLSPLTGMKLTALTASDAYFSDLGPLQGMPMEYLHVAGPRAGPMNLSPLRGMPLKIFYGTSNDYSPLRGIAFRYLELNVVPSTMPGLAGLETQGLRLVGPHVRSLEVLSQVRVKRLEIVCHAIRDLTPLRECRELEDLTFNGSSAPIEPLRGHPTLKRIAYSRPGELSAQLLEVERFWAEYDAKQAAAKK